MNEIDFTNIFSIFRLIKSRGASQSRNMNIQALPSENHTLNFFCYCRSTTKKMLRSLTICFMMVVIKVVATEKLEQCEAEQAKHLHQTNFHILSKIINSTLETVCGCKC